MRNLILIGLLASLVGCDQSHAPDPRQPASGQSLIPCAVEGAKEFSEVCAVDRAPQDGKMFLVVRHPSGSFRRLEMLTDGRGVVTADGMAEAHLMSDGKLLEVTIENDRYRFPIAPVKDAPKP